jgi:hypothetical protein
MKTKNLFLTVVLLFIATLNYAQTSAEASGIAIQGIARDAGNTARIDTPITLTFGLYYLNGTTIVPIGSPVDANLTTDNFGVFSYVLEAGVENNATMANHQAYLKISEGSTTISDEKLNHVPYAIAANNGVPTGSIMPFVGASTDVPNGWVLCNGGALPTTATKLIDMIGDNAPNLGGMFLRGAGDNTNTGYETNDGPALNSTQGDLNKTHNHVASDADNALINSYKASHEHNITAEEFYDFNLDDLSFTGTTGNAILQQDTFTSAGVVTTDGPFSQSFPISNPSRTFSTASGGGHNHTISGATANTGAVESRPVNYGVNYIIKL